MSDSRNDISLKDSLFKVLEGSSGSNSSDRATALILAMIEEFYEDVKLIRKLIGYDVIKRPDETWFTDKRLGISVEHLIGKYRLDFKWYSSLQTLVILGYLTMPSKAVEISPLDPHPDYKPGSPFSFIVTVNAGLTVRQLLKHIEREGAWIREYLDAIPSSTSLGIQDNAINWGSFVWRVKEFIDPSLSYQEIHDLSPEEDTPDRAELHTYYKRFLAALDKIKPQM